MGLTYRSVACTGTTTTNILEGQKVFMVRPVPPQVDVLSRNTKLVTLSIGGNDIDWWGLISSCFPSWSTADARDAVFVSEFFDRFNDVLSSAAQRSGATYVDIAAAAVGHDRVPGRIGGSRGTHLSRKPRSGTRRRCDRRTWPD